MRRGFTFLFTMCLILSMGVATQAQVRITINSPASLAGEITEFSGTTGWSKLVVPDEPLTADVVVVESELSGGAGETPQMGCGPSQSGQYDGKIVLARRGVCAFSQKVQGAVDAGAAAVFIVNNADGLITMSAAAGVYIDVYVHMLTQANGGALISAIEGGETVNITIERLPVDDSQFDLIWGGAGDPNSEFIGGLNDWTVRGVSCFGLDSDDSLALWTWGFPPVTQGGCGSGAIQSPSVYNGAMSFDSDFLNDAGQACPPVGGGPCPAPHHGELISPVIDISGVEGTIAVKFNQNYRRFSGPTGQGSPATFIEVTRDGGATWTRFEGFNNDIAVNAATPSNSQKVVDITAAVAGADEMQFKFVFEGEYYYWQVDDVYLIRLPENSLSLGNVFFPPLSRFIPKAHATADTFGFSALVSNRGGNFIDNAFMKVEIIDADNNVYFADSTQTPPLGIGAVDSLAVADFIFDPGTLEPGEYFIRYSVVQPGIDDFDPSDNFRSLSFNITDNSFWQSSVLRRWVRPAFEGAGTERPWGFGSYFLTYVDAQEEFIIDGVEISPQGETSAEDLDGKGIEVYLLEVLSGTFGESSTTLFDETNELVAEGFGEMSAADHQELFTIDLVDFDLQKFRMEKGKLYCVMILMDTGMRLGDDNQYPTPNAELYWDGAFRGGSFTNSVPYIKLRNMVTTVDEKPLPETYVQLFPNPASHSTNVSFDFDKSMDVTITLADINGRVINFKNIAGVQQHNEQVDLSALAAGTYIIRVATPEGTATRKIMVIK
jgi:hypothetical protein